MRMYHGQRNGGMRRRAPELEVRFDDRLEDRLEVEARRIVAAGEVPAAMQELGVRVAAALAELDRRAGAAGA